MSQLLINETDKARVIASHLQVADTHLKATADCVKGLDALPHNLAEEIGRRLGDVTWHTDTVRGWLDTVPVAAVN